MYNRELANKLRLQVIHEDNDTYVIEDMRFKTSMVHGKVIKTCKTLREVDTYLKYLAQF